MPTIEDIGPYESCFYSAEGSEAPHVPVRRDRETANFWLDTVRLARSRKFSGRPLRVIQKMVEENRETILHAWNEHFGY